MTLYVVTEGDYSAYHIIGIYSTKEKAEKVKSYHSTLYKCPDIEEWEMDDIPEDIEDVREYYHVTYIDRQYGEGRWCCRRYTKVGKENIKDCPYELDTRFPLCFKIDIPCDRVKDKQHAIKIAQDKLAEIKAMKEGIC